MHEWTEGVCDDGAAILRDGVMVPITDLLTTLNRQEKERARNAELEAALKLIVAGEVDEGGNIRPRDDAMQIARIALNPNG